MPKSSNQKLKPLYLMQMLLERSDENHPLTVQDMIDELSLHDISAERKSIYSDLEALRVFGLDIMQSKGKSTGYYIASRDFELSDVERDVIRKHMFPLNPALPRYRETVIVTLADKVCAVQEFMVSPRETVRTVWQALRPSAGGGRL